VQGFASGRVLGSTLLVRSALCAFVVAYFGIAVKAQSTPRGPKQDRPPSSSVPATPEVVRAKRFEIVDGNGQVAGVLGTVEGGAAIVLFNKQGGAIGLFSMDNGEMDVAISDKNRHGVVHVRTAADGTPRIELDDQREKPRMILSFTEDSRPIISVLDENGVDRAVMTVKSDRSGMVEIHDDKNRILSTVPPLANQTSIQNPAPRSVPNLPPPIPFALPSPSSPMYFATGSGHWIQTVSSNGRIITLEDGSLWEIQIIDQIDTALWLPVTDIVVRAAPSPSGEYRYQLINKDDGETALAKYLGKE
jgi:hypothetical protein